MSETYYFAYGANMSSRVLARRKINPASAELAWLENYSLTFSHPGPPLIEPAFASVTHAPLAKVYQNSPQCSIHSASALGWRLRP